MEKCRLVVWVAVVFLTQTTFHFGHVRADENGPSGEVVYKQMCARCHGANGEGNDKHYPQPLTGDRSLLELADYIHRTMPEGEKEKCNEQDSQRVAEFIHAAFYSPIAQARIRPPRVDLARLTVRQFRNSVADLVGSFQPTDNWGKERGLRAEYFKSRRQQRDERMIERIDPVVQFDFGEGTPDNSKFKTEEFLIRWEGSVIAPDTGEYEFAIFTENGARLWINNDRQPLIDAAVKSGKGVTERRESIHLIGGRAYPIKLEFFKSKEAKEKRASIVLKWKQPKRTDELIPQRNLIPKRLPETFVLQTAFPPDDRSMGFERGSSISKAWEQAVVDSAVEVAEFVNGRINDIGGRNNPENRTTRLKEFCLRLAERAFRRPLSDDQKSQYVTRQFDEASSPELAVQRVVLLVLQSPRFLFPELGQSQDDGYRVASRLALSMWDSIPDERLLKAAEAGKLSNHDQVMAEANRMESDPRARAKLREFLLQWLKVNYFADLSKDSQQFPDFNAELASDLRTSLDLFLEEIVDSDAADYRQLLLSDSMYLNGRLQDFYKVDVPADALAPGEPGFRKIDLKSGERAGVLTHPYLLSGFAYTSTSSPIHRGVFIARSILGRTLRTPPIAVAPLAPDLHAELTTRERVMLQTKPEVCQSCHAMVNPLGFTLEHFDAVGRFRSSEQGKPVDSSGTYLTRTGEQKRFADIQELAEFLATTDETHGAFVDQLFHNLIKQPIRAHGIHVPDELKTRFEQNQFNIRKLMVDIAVTASMAKVGSAMKSE